jgi:hypothetical protein
MPLRDFDGHVIFYSGSPKNPHGESPPFPQLEETEVLFEMEKNQRFELRNYKKFMRLPLQLSP